MFNRMFVRRDQGKSWLARPPPPCRADTLAWKLEVLAQGAAYTAPLLGQVQQRVLVLVSHP